MRKWMMLLVTLAPVLGSAGPAWRWVDADGVVHYSDRPQPGAVEIELTTSSRRAPEAAARSASQGQVAAPAAAATPASYTQFDISSPAQQETLWNIGSTLDVQVAVAPRLFPEHHLDLMLDGERQRVPGGDGTTLTLTNVFRGIHTVQAVILDASDQVVLRSNPVEFMVQQTSIQNQNNPNRPARPAN